MPPIVAEIFESFPHVHTIQWDGMVRVNGETEGEGAIFEPLWDYFVDTPFASWGRH